MKNKKYLLVVGNGATKSVYVIRSRNSYPAYLQMLFGKNIEIKKEPELKNRNRILEKDENYGQALVHDRAYGNKPISYTVKFDVLTTEEFY